MESWGVLASKEKKPLSLDFFCKVHLHEDRLSEEPSGDRCPQPTRHEVMTRDLVEIFACRLAFCGTGRGGRGNPLDKPSVRCASPSCAARSRSRRQAWATSFTVFTDPTRPQGGPGTCLLRCAPKPIHSGAHQAIAGFSLRSG